MKELNRGGEVFCGDVFGWFGRRTRIQKLGLAFWPAGLDDHSFGSELRVGGGGESDAQESTAVSVFGCYLVCSRMD